MFLKVFRKSESTPDESELLSQYRQSGDLQLLGKLYQPHMEMLYAVCYKYLKDEDEAKDAVMQVFEEVIAKAQQHEISNWKSWLHSVVKNYCLMRLRSQKTKVQDFFDPERMESEAPEHLIIEESDEPLEVQALEECMGKLNPDQHRTVSLFFLQEKSYKQIVDETGYDFNQVKSFIQNGRRNLKLCIERINERLA
ncbi:sigma-70 family RNA polymerase sigma factor [Siphonobacter sp. SORGH_AS_0500]|uniref:RNA polymerase sigma factor n=1 Tax=Siphonobacter sp. SORGH_AS_0500 TaxID=1864824 RepID=UPI002854DC2C|nr:sigma-70 family RNA polymerase sigma factor [Siphonobacter sp. SORGH_AS_0500]MDR6196939.1 RNA polymerase sigma factor (sigma-70 family) [Siphonobacter sp. SORGH_AS_0500]